MTTNEPSSSADQDAGRESPPRPTYAPAAMALGLMMLLWGIVTMWIMSAAGVGLMAWSLWTWIEDIRNA